VNGTVVVRPACGKAGRLDGVALCAGGTGYVVGGDSRSEPPWTLS
jgi:hypothetical protein